MKIFLSWSGELSHKIALILRNRLPLLLNGLDLYVSSEDCKKGNYWDLEIHKELLNADYGIVCITKDSVQSPWLNFEAGVLSHSLMETNLCPLLFELNYSEISGPLSQFQMCILQKDDMLKLIRRINELLGKNKKNNSDKLEKQFEVWWIAFEKDIEKLSEKIITKRKKHAKKIINWAFILFLIAAVGGISISHYFAKKKVYHYKIPPQLEERSFIYNNNGELLESKTKGIVIKIEERTNEGIRFYNGFLVPDDNNCIEISFGYNESKHLSIFEIREIEYKDQGDSIYAFWSISTENKTYFGKLTDSIFYKFINPNNDTLVPLFGHDNNFKNTDNPKQYFDISVKTSLRLNGVECFEDELILLSYDGMIYYYNLDDSTDILPTPKYQKITLKGEGWQSIDLLYKDKNTKKYYFLATKDEDKKIYELEFSKYNSTLSFLRISNSINLDSAFKGVGDAFKYYEGCCILEDKNYILQAILPGSRIFFKEKEKDKFEPKPIIIPENSYVEGIAVDSKNNKIYVSDRDGNIYWTTTRDFLDKNNRENDKTEFWRHAYKIDNAKHCQEIAVDNKFDGLWVAAENEVFYLDKTLFYPSWLKIVYYTLLFISIISLYFSSYLFFRVYQLKRNN